MIQIDKSMAAKKSGGPRIKVQANGPYLVTGNVPIREMFIGVDSDGASEKWVDGMEYPHGETYILCRCGKSKNPPFCDGSHVKAGFEGKEVASIAPFDEQADVLEGATLNLLDYTDLCAIARFCTRGRDVWAYTRASDNPKDRKLAIYEANSCPSGRLVAVEKNGRRHEPRLEPSIGVVEDPSMECSGPLWVRGGIQVEGADGRLYELRNRVTLCRCGRTTNSPFCDGTHTT